MFDHPMPVDPTTVDPEEMKRWEKERYESRMRENLHILKLANDIRTNLPLMSELREFIRQTRDELATLLDDMH